MEAKPLFFCVFFFFFLLVGVNKKESFEKVIHECYSMILYEHIDFVCYSSSSSSPLFCIQFHVSMGWTGFLRWVFSRPPDFT